MSEASNQVAVDRIAQAVEPWTSFAVCLRLSVDESIIDELVDGVDPVGVLGLA